MICEICGKKFSFLEKGTISVNGKKYTSCYDCDMSWDRLIGGYKLENALEYFSKVMESNPAMDSALNAKLQEIFGNAERLYQQEVNARKAEEEEREAQRREEEEARRREEEVQCREAEPVPPRDKSYVCSAKGARGRTLEVYEDKCVIRVDITLGSILTGNVTDGEKTIYYSDVIGVQIKKSGLLLGYLQIETASGSMNNRHSNFWNENSFTFEEETQEIVEAVEYIKRRVEEIKVGKTIPSASIQPVQAVSAADEIKKFKELLDLNIITQEEFDAKKKQLLGL